MDLADRAIISCLLLAEGAEPGAVRGYVEAVCAGLAAGEDDARSVHSAFMDRARRADRSSPSGKVARLLAAKRDHDETCRRFGMAVSGMEKAFAAVSSGPRSGLGARIALAKALEAIGEAAGAMKVAPSGFRVRELETETAR